jgi:O-antigen/teichoic acid export membrane protein
MTRSNPDRDAAHEDGPLPVSARLRRIRATFGDLQTFFREHRWRVRRWAFQGGWAVCDQGLTSMASLFVQVMLARWLPAVDYGAFVASYAVLLIVSVLHTGILLEPMVVFGSGRYAQWFSDYVRLLLRGHFQLTLASAVVLAGIASILEVLGQDAMARALLGAALIGPVLLLWWLARRACNAVSRPQWAAAASTGYFIAVITGATILYQTNTLSVLTAQLVMGVSAILAGLPLLRALLRITSEPMPAATAAQVRQAHLKYGRWSSASGMMSWLQTQSYYVVLPMWAGLEATAALRAVINLVQPLIQWDFALTGLVLPSLVRARQELGSFRRRLGLAAAYFMTEGLTYGVLLVLFGDQLMKLAYGGSYTAGMTTLMLLAGVPVLIALCGVFSSALNAAERPERVFRGAAAGGATVVVVGLWAATTWGLTGALAGLLLSSLVQMTVLASSLPASTPQTTPDRTSMSDGNVVGLVQSRP